MSKQTGIGWTYAKVPYRTFQSTQQKSFVGLVAALTPLPIASSPLPVRQVPDDPQASEMTTPKETLWEADLHTKAKHEILGRYLAAWFPILSAYHSRIVYIDGFSGLGSTRRGRRVPR